jgi:hypothetical protein
MIQALQEAWSRLVAVSRRTRLDRDFDNELAAHVDLLTERNQRRGLSHTEARRQPILQVGGLNAARDLHRDSRGMPRAERVIYAWREAWRSVWSAKAPTLLAATALAVGLWIGDGDLQRRQRTE